MQQQQQQPSQQQQQQSSQQQQQQQGTSNLQQMACQEIMTVSQMPYCSGSGRMEDR
jgi:hypothetical protein